MEKFLSDVLDTSLFEKGKLNVIDAPCGCGKTTARQIGEASGAKITIGRRVLYSVSKVERYVEAIAL